MPKLRKNCDLKNIFPHFQLSNIAKKPYFFDFTGIFASRMLPLFLLMLIFLFSLSNFAGADSTLKLANKKVNTVAISPKNPSIAIDSSKRAHVVWQDMVDGKFEIFYSRSSDSVEWTPQVRISNNIDGSTTPYDSKMPKIATDGDKIYVVWQDSEQGHEEIYFTRSLDGGDTWSATPVLVANDSYASTAPDIAVSSTGRICVVWEDHRSGRRAIYYALNTNSGSSFAGSDLVFAESSTASLNNPRIAVDSNGTFHVVWYTENNIYYNNSITPNSSISTKNLSNTPYASKNPSIACTGNSVHVVWQDFNDFNWNIYYKTYSAGAWQSTITTIIQKPGTSEYPAITGDSSGNVHVAWQDKVGSNSEIFYRKREFDKNPSQWEAEVKLTDSESGDATRPVSIASNRADSDNGVHIVWTWANNIYYTKLPKDGLSDKNPVLTDSYPEDDGKNISPNSKIWAVFSADMLASTVEDGTTFMVYKERTPNSDIWDELTGSISYFSAGRKLTFSPDDPLAFGTRYKATITSQATSIEGDRFVGKTWFFATSTGGGGGDGDLQISNILAFPSPWRGDGYITISYLMLYDAAETVNNAWFAVYSKDGRQIFKDDIDPSGGTGTYEWDGRDKRGNLLGNGLYFYRIDAKLSNGKKATATSKLMIIR